MKFTFKTDRPTGSFASFFPNYNHIKLDKKKVGSIDDKTPFKIKLMVIKDDIMEDNNPNCEWKWITLKKESQSLQEAKDFLNKYIADLVIKYKLHLSEQ